MNIHLDTLIRMSIRKKLLSAFIFLILIVAVTGGFGFTFIRLIRQNVELLTNVVSPLNSMSNEIYNDMLQFNILTFNLQNAATQAAIDQYAVDFKRLEEQFKQKTTGLEQFTDKLDTTLNLKNLKDNQDLFFENLHLAESSQSLKLGQIRTIKETLARFNQKRSQLDESLEAYIQSARTSIGQAEEKGMVLAMNPEAALLDATDLIKQMFEKTLPVLYKGDELRTFLTILQDLTKSFLLETETPAMDTIQQSFMENTEKITSRLKRLKRKLETDEILKIYETVVTQFDELFTLVLGEQGLFAAHRKLLEHQNSIKQLQASLEDVTRKFKAEITSVLEKSNEINHQVQDTTGNRVRTAQFYIGIIVLIGFIAGVSGAVIIIASIIKPLNRLRQIVHEVEKTSDFSLRSDLAVEDEVGQTSSAFNAHMARIQTALSDVNTVMASISKGNFSKSVLSQQDGDLDLLKQSINESIKLLSQTIEGVITVGSHVGAKADTLSESTTNLKKSAIHQAENLKSISLSMDEIESMAKNNENSAVQVLEFSDRAISEVNSGNRQMSDMLLSMKKIEETGSDVGNAIKIIDDIASQTHLLALNAAIEAVRVGEVGRGFAVVAQEIRALAGRSAKAAKDSDALIKKSIEEVKKGMENADHTAAALSEIYETVERVNRLVNAISDASVEQSSRIKNTNLSVARMNEAIVKDSVVVEETVAAVDELKKESTDLQGVLGRFILKKKP
ncbi:MAG: methyl-accepting chemotaxis protein [Pseudomonadota bacterium]